MSALCRHFCVTRDVACEAESNEQQTPHESPVLSGCVSSSRRSVLGMIGVLSDILRLTTVVSKILLNFLTSKSKIHPLANITAVPTSVGYRIV